MLTNYVNSILITHSVERALLTKLYHKLDMNGKVGGHPGCFTLVTTDLRVEKSWGQKEQIVFRPSLVSKFLLKDPKPSPYRVCITKKRINISGINAARFPSRTLSWTHHVYPSNLNGFSAQPMPTVETFVLLGLDWLCHSRS